MLCASLLVQGIVLRVPWFLDVVSHQLDYKRIRTVLQEFEVSLLGLGHHFGESARAQ